MLNLKTYFEQVPLELVKQIVEKQIRMDEEDESTEGIDKGVRKEDLTDAEGRHALTSRTLARSRLLN